MQPLDVGSDGPLQRIYDHEYHKTIQQNSSVITRNKVCELACQAYQKSLYPEHLHGAFRKYGIYLDGHVFNRDQLKPSDVFIPTEDIDKTTDTDPECLADEANDQNNGKKEVVLLFNSCIVVVEDGQDVQTYPSLLKMWTNSRK